MRKFGGVHEDLFDADGPLVVDEDEPSYGEATAVDHHVDRVVGAAVELDEPALGQRDGLGHRHAGAAHATRVELVLGGQPCVLVQLVPRAFVVKMTRALDELSAVEETAPGATAGAVAGPDSPSELLRGVALRVSAEIGRSSMPLARAVSMPPGALIELDRAADEAVDLLVNGRRFATGRLVLVDDEWAVRVEDVFLDPHDLPRTTTTPIERT